MVDLVAADDAGRSSAMPALAKPLSAGEAENIAVCIRVRPLNEREVRSRDCNVLRTQDALNVISVTDVDGAPLGGKHNVFQYDHIFDETRSTRYMYRRVAQRIVRSTLEGINGTIFAYGQTSSGKTFTMQGSDAAGSAAETDAGILQLAVEDIFSYIESCDDRDFLLRVSFVEIYNEVVRDLLTSSDRGGNLKVREDPRKGVYVECKEEIITSYQDILRLLALGNERRTVGQTAMNERSSRSHSIFRIVVESKQRSDGARRQSEDDMSGAVLVACLSLVDLAGSESVRHTAAEGIRQREAGSINKSLLTLSRVINALASASSSASSSAAAGAATAAPFRDSKLTRLLQNSLDGNTRTLIVCCVTPSERFLDETRSTLQFAARAKHLQTSASVNEVLDDQAQLKRLKREVHELKKLVGSDALSQLKAENEALMHDQRRHKDEYARLLSLILTSTARAPPASDSKRKPRAKRSRETWCPGDFPVLRGLENALPPPPSPNLQPRKRRSRDSGAKENVEPQNLLGAMHDEADDDDDDDSGQGLGGGDRMHVLTAKLLAVLELALQNSHDDDDGDDNCRALGDALAQVHELIACEEDQERLAELLQDLKALADRSANAEHLRGENELLNMEVEELHRKLGLLSDSSAPSSQEESSSSAEALDALQRQLAEAQQALAKEREEAKVRDEQLEALRAEVAEKQQLESALADEMAQMKTQHETQRQQLVAERAGLTDAMAALEAQLQHTAKYHSELEAQVTFLVGEKRALTDKVEALEGELQAESNGGEAAGLSTELQTLLQDVAKLQVDLETATTENEALAAERDAIKQELEQIRDGVPAAAAAAAVASVQAELASLKQSSGEELERLRMELEFATNEKQASAINIQDLSDERAQLAEALRSIQGEMEQLVGESVQKADRLESDVATLRADKETRESEFASLQAKLEAAREEMARLKMKLVEVDEERHALLATVSTLETGGDSQTSKLSAEIAEYEATVAEQETAIEQLRAELALSDEEHAALRVRIEELAVFEAKAAELELEITRAKNQQVDGAKVIESEDANAQADEPRRLQAFVSGERSAGEQSELLDRIAALEEENEKVNAELDGVAGQRRELFEELSALEAQLMDESQEKMRLRAAVDALEKQLRESGATSELTSELERARQAESVLMNELETLSAALEKQEGENKRLQARRTSSDGGDDVDALRQRLEIERELRATLELDVKSYEDALQVVRRELKDSAESITDLLERLKAMEAEVDALTQAKATAEREVESARELARRAKEEQDELRFQSQQRALLSEQQDASTLEALGKLEQQLQDAHETIRNQQEALDAQQQREAADQTSSMLEKTVDDLQEQLLASRKALALQTDEWRAKHDDAEQRVARLTSDLETRTSDVARLNEELTAAHDARAELQRDRQVLEQQLGEIDAKWRAKEQALSQQVAAELASAKTALNDIAAQKEALETALRESDAQWRAKEQALSQQAAAELDSVREQYQEAQEELDSYQKYADDEIHKLRAAVEASDVEAELAKAREDELSAERKTLEEKLASLLSTRDDAVDHLEHELREATRKCEQTESQLADATELVKELKAAMEQLEGEAYRHRNELEDLSEALKSAQMEAVHYHDQLEVQQRGREELETLVETQRKRIDKLEKVKMTTETLELFRRLKSDRAELQATVQTLQQEAESAKESAKQQTTRLLQRKEEELAAMREQVAEVERELQTKKEKAQEVIEGLEVELRERAAHVAVLEQQVDALAKEKSEVLAHKSGNVTYLEKENLELLVENRQLKKRLESSGSDSSTSRRTLADAPDFDPSAAAAAAILAESHAGVEFRDSLLSAERKSSSDERPVSTFLLSAKAKTRDEEDAVEQTEEEAARPACAQQ